MRTASVLLIEDNAITRSLVSLALEAAGIGVQEAQTGADALRLWRQAPCDLVLQTLLLSDMDGFELVHKLRALPQGGQVPILAFSGLLSQAEQARVASVGFSDVVSKPIEPARLLQIVRAHLPTPSLANEQFGGGRHVLVVDDDPLQQKLVCFRLTRLGFRTSTASDGQQALELARREAPNAVVADVMMPALDGFGLCVALRNEPALAETPLVLMTNTYIEEADRELARSAGANQFVIRTPGMGEIVDALKHSLADRTPPASAPGAPPAKLEKAWARRVAVQLERQVSLNAAIARRSATLSAELSILTGISNALSRRHEVDKALGEVLAACLDAGGFSVGAFCNFQRPPSELFEFGNWEGWTRDDIHSFLHQSELLRRTLACETVWVPSSAVSPPMTTLLEKAGIASAVVVPVLQQGRPLGALILGSASTELQWEDRLTFVEGVATQIGQAVTLTQAFADKEASEQQAQERATVLRSVLESMAEGVVVTDVEGRVQHWNPAAESILKSAPRDVLARDWPDHYGLCFSETMRAVPAEESPLFLALGGQVIDGMELFVHPGPASRQGVYININARPLRDGGQTVGAVVVFRDVTEEKSTQQQLLVSDRMAAVGMLAAGVAHEINNPLAAVLANLELVLDRERASTDSAPRGVGERLEKCTPEERIVLIEEAQEGAEKIRAIVQDLKIFSRAENEQQVAVDVHKVLDSALRLARNEVRHRARVERAYGATSFVLGSESRLGQVFLNLILNAAHAIPAGQAERHWIRIVTRTDSSGRVAVEVADTGPGISPDAMKRVFTPFFTTKPVGDGTGLGLSICHRLVTAAGGEIRIESEPGHGTVVHVALVAAPSVARDDAALVPKAEVVSQARARVLIVDDETFIVSVVKRILGQEHDCVGTTAAADGLALLRQGEHFDVIFCDLMMPVMTGMDFYDHLSREHRERIVFMTGGAFSRQAQTFLSSVSNQCLEKPFSARALKTAVNAMTVESDPSWPLVGDSTKEEPRASSHWGPLHK